MRKLVLTWCVVIVVAALAIRSIVAELPDGLIHIYFFDVGQGDGYLIESPGGKRILVDAGPSRNIAEPLRKAVGYLNDDIDLVVLTHFDRDHAEGILAVLSSFDVQRVMITGVEQGTELQSTILRDVRARGIPVDIGYSDTDFWLDKGVFIDLLWPDQPLAGKFYEKANEVGIVYRLMVGRDMTGRDDDRDGGGDDGHCVLLGMADTGFPTEDALMRANPDALDCDILKVGHHGSKYSSGDAFLRAVSPALSLISVGRKNRYGHPTRETLERLQAANSRVLRTDLVGSVEISLKSESGEILEIKPER
jgi:competence protein ComEC